MTRHGWILALCLGVVGAIASCGSDAKVGPGSAGGGASAGDTASGPGSGSGGSGGGHSIGIGGGISSSLVIDPPSATLEVDGSPETFEFTAKLSSGETANGVVWSNDPDLPGYVDQSGVFHSGGFTAGKTTIHATWNDVEAVATLEISAKIVENAGGLTPDQQDALRNGGSSDPNFRWFYPYNKTIFPRGIDAPVLQLSGSADDATYVKVTLPNFTYEGFFGPSDPTRIQLPKEVWEGITLSAGAADDVTVSVTKMSNGNVTGPLDQVWRIAQGSLKGVIYYNTYDSGGAVKRIRPGEQAETFISGCVVCHSVASRGTVLAAGANWSDQTSNPVTSNTYNLNADGTVGLRHSDGDGRKFSFAALTPDGAYALGNAVPANGPMPRGMQGAFPTRLFDTATGAEVNAPSFTDVVGNAITPAFSHDGKYVAFNHQQGAGKDLKMMDVDLGQSPPVFSNVKHLVVAEGDVAAWPSFLPDSQGIVYHDGNSFDTQQGCSDARFANLRLVDIASETVIRLDALNGRDPNGDFYLPFGEGEEANVNYEPTVLPVPVGGYYWVIFTSRRAYGNYLGPGGSDGGASKWGTCNPETPSKRKKIWIAAIDTNWQGTSDPSHPAFYLPGQDLGTGNMRAFAALEPCREDSAPCEYGFECCDGRQCLPTGEVDEHGKSKKACAETSGECSPAGGPCETSADCCNGGLECIGGYCAIPSPN